MRPRRTTFLKWGGLWMLTFSCPAWAQGQLCYADTVRADAPTLYWRLGDASGPVQDTSGKGNNGTARGDVRFAQPGALVRDSDGSIRLDGTSADILSSPVTVQGNFSFELWGRADSVIETLFPAIIREADDRVRYTQVSGGKWRAGVRINSNNNPDEVASQSLDVTQWHHIVYTLENGTLGKLYVDGALQAQAPTSPMDVTAALTLGWKVPGAIFEDRFAGWVDEVALYDKPLSAERIAAHHAAGLRTGSPYADGASCCTNTDCQSQKCDTGLCAKSSNPNPDPDGGGEVPGPEGSPHRDPFVVACSTLSGPWASGGLTLLSLATAPLLLRRRRSERRQR